MHRQSAGIAYGRRALALAQRLEEPLLVAKASRTVGNLLVRANDLDAGLKLLEEALALAVAIDDPTEAAECGACLAIAYSWSIAWDRCIEVATRSLAWIERCHDLYALRHLYAGFATLHSVRGEWTSAEQMIERAQVVRPSVGSMGIIHLSNQPYAERRQSRNRRGTTTTFSLDRGENV